MNELYIHGSIPHYVDSYRRSYSEKAFYCTLQKSLVKKISMEFVYCTFKVTLCNLNQDMYPEEFS